MNRENVTMYTIADRLGVSIAAVSRAFDPHSSLRPEKRDRILRTAKELGYTPNRMAARLSGETIRIGVLIWGEFKQYYDEFVRGTRDAADAFAGFKVACDLRVLDKAVNPPAEALAVLDSFLRDRFSGVILAGLMSPEYVAELNRLADAGIPLFLLDTDLPGCRCTGVSMNDLQTTGALAAQLLACAMTSRENRVSAPSVVALFSDLSLYSQRTLRETFCASASRYGFTVSDVFETHNRPELEAEITSDLFARDRPPDGFYVASACSAPLLRYVDTNGLSGSVGIVTSDLYEEQNRYLINGTVFATIYQNPYEQARAAFEALYYFIDEGRTGERLILANPIPVFSANLHRFV